MKIPYSVSLYLCDELILTLLLKFVRLWPWLKILKLSSDILMNFNQIAFIFGRQGFQ